MPRKREQPVHEVIIGGVSVRLPRSEYEVLRVLQQHQGAPITTTALEQELPDKRHYKVPGQYARQTLSQLRKRLSYFGLPGARLIRTVYGLGYAWVEPGGEAASPG